MHYAGRWARTSPGPGSLHFGNSDVDLDNPDNVAKVKRVFEAANRFHMPIVVHMHTSLDMHRRYGAAEARVFLNELLPAAPDVPVQIAHLTGSGGYDAATDRTRQRARSLIPKRAGPRFGVFR